MPITLWILLWLNVSLAMSRVSSARDVNLGKGFSWLHTGILSNRHSASHTLGNAKNGFMQS